MNFADTYRGRAVLVTGHTGFKGSWLATWLRHLGAEVAGYSLGLPTDPCNFAVLDLGSRVRHYCGDIRERVAFARVVDEVRPSIIFHLAAQALVQRSYSDPATTFETNAMGMVSVLECLRTRPWIEAAILITSDKVYRNDEWCWGYRETDVLGGRDPYSASKSCADLIATSYYRSFLRNGRSRVAVTRAGNVIGGGDWADDRIVPDCVRAWSRGRSAAVRNPRATRPWQHVLEPLSGYLWLGARLLAGQAGLNGEAFNFGPETNVTQTVAQLLEAMAAKWPGVAWHTPQECEPGAPEALLLKLSYDKALFHLKWKPILQFNETVQLTVDWYRQWHQGEAAMYQFTLGQIDSYCELARARAVGWAGP